VGLKDFTNFTSTILKSGELSQSANVREKASSGTKSSPSHKLRTSSAEPLDSGVSEGYHLFQTLPNVQGEYGVRPGVGVVGSCVVVIVVLVLGVVL
jgi:hypothetical protein